MKKDSGKYTVEQEAVSFVLSAREDICRIFLKSVTNVTASGIEDML